MDPERWRQVQTLFERALEAETPDAQARLLAEAEREDPPLAREVRALLEADASQDSLLDDPATEELPDNLQRGSMIGEFEIQEMLGAGAFGAVYLAEHPTIGRRAAVKVLHRSASANPHHVARFITEARAAAAMGHPNIVDVFDFGQLADGRRYAIMEYVEGSTLGAVAAARGRMSVGEVAPLLEGVARALEAAHARGIVHRDLKPDNVMVIEGPDGPTSKLLDFGIAKLLDGPGDSPQTATGAIVGTPTYMSPEQVKGAPVSPASDVYAFAVMTYRLLTGRPPFTADSTVALLMKHLSDPPAPLSIALPPALEAMILAGLGKSPDERPGLRAFMDAVNEAARAPEADELPAPRPLATDVDLAPAPHTVQTIAAESAGLSPGRRAVAIAAAALAVALAGALAAKLLSARAPPPEAPVATPRNPPPAERVPPTSILVQVRVLGTPRGAEVLGPNRERWGALPATLTLPRSETPLELRIEAPGHRPAALHVTPNADQALQVDLRRAPRPAPKVDLHPDLEAPPF